jgi:hypothetical protein
MAVTTPDGLEYEVHQKDLATVLSDRWGNQTGNPRSFTRRGGVWTFGPIPQAGTTVRIDYYDEFPALSAPTDANYLTASSDLVIYAALSFAGDWFVDKRAPAWENRFQGIVSEIQNQADQDAMINAQVSAAYEFPED